MPTKRRVVTRTPSTWIDQFLVNGAVPDATADPAGWHELTNHWCLGRAILGLPLYHSAEGRALIRRAIQPDGSPWCPLR